MCEEGGTWDVNPGLLIVLTVFLFQLCCKFLSSEVCPLIGYLRRKPPASVCEPQRLSVGRGMG